MAAAEDVRTDLLGLMGLESVDHGPAGMSARMMGDLNAARQEIYAAGPDSFYVEEPRAEIVRAPTSVTLGAVTANSKAITFSAFDATWQLGCTIVIAGDDTQNRLVLAGSNVSLMVPYKGSSGSNVSATIYQDVVLPGADVEQVMGPVRLNGLTELIPLPHARDVLAGERFGMGSFPLPWSPREIRLPRQYGVERSAVYSTGVTGIALRFTTLPDQASTLHFTAKLKPRAVTDWNDARTELVPMGYHESILLPIVRYKFSTWPNFTGDKTGLAEDYKSALITLRSLRPRGDRGTEVAVGEDW